MRSRNKIKISAVQAQRLSVDQRLNLLLHGVRHFSECETGARRESDETFAFVFDSYSTADGTQSIIQRILLDVDLAYPFLLANDLNLMA